ncbi:hypothetical protein ANTQUA_LOCUS3425 [Anthophora quadrimaculata]
MLRLFLPKEGYILSAGSITTGHENYRSVTPQLYKNRIEQCAHSKPFLFSFLPVRSEGTLMIMVVVMIVSST